MLPSPQGTLDKLLVPMGADNNKLDGFIGKETLGREVVARRGKVHGTMAPLRRRFTRRRRRLSLEKGDDLQLRIGQDIREVEAFGRKAVADDADLDGRQGRGHWNKRASRRSWPR